MAKTPYRDRWTVNQIIHKIGKRRIGQICKINPASTAKWRDDGIPGRHWRALVHAVDWLTFEDLDTATTIALKRFRRLS